MFDKRRAQMNHCSLDYAYEIKNNEDVNTYAIQEQNGQIIRFFMEHYYLFVLGEKTIEKLRGRGYLSMDEIYQKYQVTEIPIVESEKKEGFMKTFFRKGN